MIKRNLVYLALFGLMSISPVHSQETTSQDIINSYIKELNLDGDQGKQFTDVLLKFAPQFKEGDIKAADFNVLMKKETLEIYGILNMEQFAKYKKLKESIEPNKKYRIGNNKN